MWKHWNGHLINLINNRRMFNVCIRYKKLHQWICCKCLSWWHRHSYFWSQRLWRLLEAKNTPQRPKKAWKSWYIKKVWALTSNKKDTSQQPQLSPNPRVCAKLLRSRGEAGLLVLQIGKPVCSTNSQNCRFETHYSIYYHHGLLWNDARLLLLAKKKD